MIEIVMCGEDYEQDIRPLIKSFFPDQEQQVVWQQEANPDRVINPDGAKNPDRVLAVLNPNHFLVAYYQENRCISECSETVKAGSADAKQVRRSYRNQLLRAIYGVLTKATKKELPWGILTGVRPTKLVLEQLEAGKRKEEIHSHMLTEYCCSPEKTELSLKVASKELELLQAMDYKNSYSLYIGIPFCPSICNYCSFSSYPVDRYGSMIEAYLTALSKEIRYAKACFPEKSLSTVYIGGGTPTTLSAAQLTALIQTIRKTFDLTGTKEFTVEAGRPDSITLEKLEALKAEGVTRISINPQSMQQKTLDEIGRNHTVEQVEEAFRLARMVGHDNINLDLIIGLYGETCEDVESTLLKIRPLAPEALTVHTLAEKRAARLTTERKRYEGRKAAGVTRMLDLTMEFAKNQGYEPYYLYRQKHMAENLENIGYSKPGREGLYNILIMEEKQIILALGAGASSKFVFCDENRFERVENVKNVPDYISRIDEMIERKKTFLRQHENLLWR